MDHQTQVVQQLEDLKSFYTRDWPKYCKEYYCLDNFLDLHKWDRQLKDVKVYALPNLEHGLFVIVNFGRPTVGFSLKSVSLEDAQVIDDHWEWSEHGSLSYIQRQICYNTSVGLYKDDDNELVAWCIRAQDGLLAALQVKPSYKRRGFGVMIVKEYSRREAEQGRDIITEVVPENKASLNLFKKLGFRMNDQCHWLITEAPNGDLL
nr:uncharacterized protein LOC108067607 isoform X2 [Drosophila takahashii]